MEEQLVADLIQIRRDTAANWVTEDPTLGDGELGLETDTGIIRIGDGTVVFTLLPAYKPHDTPAPINFYSATDHTLVIGDAYHIVEMSSTANRVLTIPLNSSVDFDVGVLINVVKILTGDVTITGATGVTLNGASAGSGVLTDVPWSGVALYQRSTNNWVANGAIGLVA